ncbi:MAG: chemotaxis protein CheB [Clostridiales bacterium]|nr:chemotaxis protein CheB [Clostridiales bacterium]
MPEYRAFLSKSPEVKVLLVTSRKSDIIDYFEHNSISRSTMIVVADMASGVADFNFLSAVKEKNIPLVAVVSSVKEGFSALEKGASDMVVRHETETDRNAFFYRMLVTQILKVAGEYRSVNRWDNKSNYEAMSGKIVAIGSSTGGTETLLNIIKQLPAEMPPVLVVQHMPPVFTKMYAERMDDQCPMHVVEARDGDRLSNGLVFIAPGDYHMTLAKSEGQFYLECKKGEKVLGQCPSVDVLFNSVANVAKENAVGVILTGMGSDGARGLLNMRQQGAHTIGQDEKTSVVYGMPRAAYEMGAVTVQLPMEKIPQEIVSSANFK